jgi:DNA adenine methylase
MAAKNLFEDEGFSQQISNGQVPHPRRKKPSPIYLRNGLGRIGSPGLKKSSTKKRIVFGWYGGKFNHLAWLLPLLPECHHYCEPFAGSAAVLLNRQPSPVETYNDIDGEAVNFFRVLRDQKNKFEDRES